jgi:hypothetical protein
MNNAHQVTATDQARKIVDRLLGAMPSGEGFIAIAILLGLLSLGEAIVKAAHIATPVGRR